LKVIGQIPIPSLFCSGIILYNSYRLHTVPQEARAYYTIILIVSIAGIFAGNGFWLGSVLGVIAEVITISRK
jgi:hypothetical protein